MPLLFASNIRSVKARLRHNDYLNWVLVERTGRIVRWLLLLALCSGAGMQLYSDVIELRDLANGTVHDWNRYWALEDVWRVPTLK